ncbi:MAG: serine hydrolase [Eubacteriales bacterium]|nr:serine hydrolase [Eubacteriales bacterium]
MSEGDFSFATPESLGIPSGTILDLLKDIRSHSIPLHSFLVMRHGYVAAEGYCAPFTQDRKHRMYSVSKSVVSVAVGMLIDEGRLSLDSRIADFFPEYVADDTSDYLRKATIRHLLMMATCNEHTAYHWNDQDFVRAFFQNSETKHMPGAAFSYDTSATVTLCAVVEKLAGKPLLEYMRPLLDKLGISGDAWCIQTPEGRSWAGSGILFTTRDLARFAQLCLHMGESNGKQLVSRNYMLQATAEKIDNYVSDFGLARCGYGYQFWMIKDGFACCGMGGQFALMYPGKDLVVVTTADTQHINAGDDFIRCCVERMVESVGDHPLPENPAAQAELTRQSVLSLPMRDGSAVSSMAEKISGARYMLEKNSLGYEWITMSFSDGLCTMTYSKRGEVLTLPLFLGRYGEFLFPEKYPGKNIAVKDTNYRCVSAAVWRGEHTLIGDIYAVDDYLGSIRLQCTFMGDTLTMLMTAAAENFFLDYRGFLSGRLVRE